MQQRGAKTEVAGCGAWLEAAVQVKCRRASLSSREASCSAVGRLGEHSAGPGAIHAQGMVHKRIIPDAGAMQKEYMSLRPSGTRSSSVAAYSRCAGHACA